MQKNQKLKAPLVNFPSDLFTLYLSHSSRSRERVRNWELGFEERNPEIALINPFYDLQGEGREDIKARDEGKPFEKDAGYSWRMYRRDIGIMTFCRGLVTVVDKNFDFSIGTPMETVYGQALSQSPRLCIFDERSDLIEHPWIKTHYDERYGSFEDFEKDVMAQVNRVRDEQGF